MATIYIDSTTLTVSEADPRQQGDDRETVDINIPAGTSAIELLGTLQGWLNSNNALRKLGVQPGTIAKVVIG